MTSARSMGLQIKHLLAQQSKNKITLQYYLSIFATMKNLFNCVHPCPCGYYGDSQKPCTCAYALVTKYQKRISDPLLDRIDLHLEVPRVDYEKLSGDRVGESSHCIRARVQAARDIQHTRFSNH